MWRRGHRHVTTTNVGSNDDLGGADKVQLDRTAREREDQGQQHLRGHVCDCSNCIPAMRQERGGESDQKIF